MTREQQTLLYLVRLGIGCNPEPDFDFRDVDWKTVVDISFEQGVVAIAVDGLQKLYDAVPDLELTIDTPGMESLKYEWFGNVMNSETEYSNRQDVTKRLSALFAPNDISTIVLKGASFAQYYPMPSHRYSCDLDLFIGSDWEKGCSILEDKGIDICYEVYKDAQFHINGVYVECHRYIMSIRGNSTLQKFEVYLRSLLKEKIQCGDDLLFVPPLMFNALFCIEHARGHLLHEKLTLRQVCDWMMIRRQPVDWDEFRKRCDEFGFTRFAKLFDALADLVEGKLRYEDLSLVDKRVVDEMFSENSSGSGKESDSFFIEED